MGIRITEPGMITTVQDQGRLGFQSFGFTVSGAMDKRAAFLANLLVGNTQKEAVLECTMSGPTLEFTSDGVFALTGATFAATLNGEPVPRYQAVRFSKRDVLEIGAFSRGMFGYIAFSGGLAVPEMMGSLSTTTKTGIGGFRGRALQSGDVIAFLDVYRGSRELTARNLPEENPSTDDVVEIRVVMGPQDKSFTEDGRITFLSSAYALTNDCNRMGYRLDGPKIEHVGAADIISDGIPFGAIQVPTSGTPIVMMADRQTTGGYTKIATTISVDIPKLVQRTYGQKVRFQKISVEEAQQLYLDEMSDYHDIERALFRLSRQSGGIRYTAERIETLYDKRTRTTDTQKEKS